MLGKIVLLFFVTSTVFAIPRPDVKDVQEEEVKVDVDICSLPAVNPGPIACSGVIPRWTYNAKTGVCEKFIYGGCFGTENLFKNEFACLAKCNQEGLEKKISESDASLPCMQKKATGNCRAFIPSFFFDTQTGTCTAFTYTGCGGNDNNFSSESECDVKCNGLQGPVTPPAEADFANDSPATDAEVGETTTELTRQEKCSLPPVNPSPFGCLAFIPSWTFNSTTGECESYVYGGCGKTANLFRSQDECNMACGPDPAVILPTKTSELMKQDDKCSLPPVYPSPFACYAAIPSWTFNSTAGKCESYMYGGCGKTANLFTSENYCSAACSLKPKILEPRLDVCRLPVVKGPCFASWKRYAFVKEKNRCELFHFGGCHGNQNNFRLADDCYRTCGGDKPSTIPECVGESCPVSNNRFIERGCRPEYKNNACCPTRFICPEEKSVEGVCRYRDISYLIGQEISQLHEDDACKTDCTCVASDKHRGGATIKCNRIFCDMPFPPQEEGCVLVTPPGACCPSYKCAKKREDTDSPANDTCIFNGKEYLKGQSIPSGHPCKWCTCVDGFNGLDGPGCREAHCVVDNRIGCVPVYASGACCPVSYKCLSAAELSQNKTRIIQIQPTTGKRGVTTLPMVLGNLKDAESKVKAETCLLPKMIGPCKMSRPSFYYDTEIEDCLPFLYGGCRGNANRFETRETCLEKCRPSAAATRIIGIAPKPKQYDLVSRGLKAGTSRSAACLLPRTKGPCRGRDTDHLFDIESLKCVPYNTGSCVGNDNRFPSLETCRKICREGEPLDVKDKFARCKLPADVGMCRGFVEKFFYDNTDKECKSFTFGGCLGNANNFDSQEQCLSTCTPPVFEGKGKARARARARTEIPGEEVEPMATNIVDISSENVCKFGNITLKIGEHLMDSETPCDECTCLTPPELTCVKTSCPANPTDINTVCEPVFVPGKCCPTYQCISGFAPPINVCEGVACQNEEHCEVQDQGIWMPPIGVCVKNIALADSAILKPLSKTESPEAKCNKEFCPPPPMIGEAICKLVKIEGECCPSYTCLSSNPPSINVCEDVICDFEEEYCEVQAQESEEGSWLPPIGVCIRNSTSIPL